MYVKIRLSGQPQNGPKDREKEKKNIFYSLERKYNLSMLVRFYNPNILWVIELKWDLKL